HRAVVGGLAEAEARRRLEQHARVHEAYERDAAEPQRGEHGPPAEEPEEVAPGRCNAPDVALRIGSVLCVGHIRLLTVLQCAVNAGAGARFPNDLPALPHWPGGAISEQPVAAR